MWRYSNDVAASEYIANNDIHTSFHDSTHTPLVQCDCSLNSDRQINIIEFVVRVPMNGVPFQNLCTSASNEFIVRNNERKNH